MSNTSTAVATATQFTVNDVPSLLEKVTKQIALIKKNIPETAQTTGNLDGFGKINEINTVESLIKAHSSIVSKAAGYNESAAAILPEGIKKPTLLINGYSPASWIEDIKARIIIVANKSELEKLEKVKTKLEANLSAEAKLNKDLSEIANILSDETK